MKCRTCGNEVSSEEVFCGQCGTPITPPQSLQTEMMRSSTSRQNNTNRYPTGNLYGQQGQQGQSQGMNDGTQVSRPQGAPPFPATQPAQSGANQNTGFYRDETEAMSILPNSQQAGYQQPYAPMSAYPPPVAPTNYGYPQQSSQQAPPQAAQQTPYIQRSPVQAGNYPGPGYQQRPLQGNQNYREGMVPAQRQSGGVVTFLVSICLVIALLSVVGVGTLFYLRSRNQSPQPNPTQVVVPTTVPTPTPDVPTPTPTLAPTDTPTPTVIPTATPLTGFAYCGTLCTDNGFSTQYPQGWAASEYSGGPGVVFANPSANDQTATFKTPGNTTSTAADLVANDLQQNFSTKDGYTVVTPIAADSLGGETWFKEVISYQQIGQPKENVEVYANVHENKAYILELQASDDQFATVASTYFQTIKSQYQFTS